MNAPTRSDADSLRNHAAIFGFIPDMRGHGHGTTAGSFRSGYGLGEDAAADGHRPGHGLAAAMLADKMRLWTGRDHGLFPVADTDGRGHGRSRTLTVTDMD